MQVNNKPILNIFDSDFIPFTVCYNKKGEPEKSLDDCINLCDNYIANINKATNADYFIGFVTRGKCFRYNINPDYKAKRKDLPIIPYSFEIRDYIIDKYQFSWNEGYEADDLVISYKANNPQYESIIVSPDKDILNLEGTHFNPKKMIFKTTSEEEAIEYFWKSMICGDTIDGIRGLKGKGEKYFNSIKAIIEDRNINLFQLNSYYRNRILESYIIDLNEYEGIKEFTKNYLSLKLVDNVKIDKEPIRINK